MMMMLMITTGTMQPLSPRSAPTQNKNIKPEPSHNKDEHLKTPAPNLGREKRVLPTPQLPQPQQIEAENLKL